MSIRVVIESTLPDWWGADDAFEDGGTDTVKELILEDLSAFVEDAKWIITKVEQ